MAIPLCNQSANGRRVFQVLINGVVSMGRRNTRTKSQVQEFKGLRVVPERKCKEKAFCLSKSELRPQTIGPQKRIARSNDLRGVPSTS
jgi:hypothetical protein